MENYKFYVQSIVQKNAHKYLILKNSQLNKSDLKPIKRPQKETSKQNFQGP